MSSRKDIRQIKCPSNDLDCDAVSPSQAPPPPPPPVGYSSTNTTATSTVSIHSSTSSHTDSSSSTTPTKSPAVAAVSSKSNAGAIAGGVIGGVVLLVLLVLIALLYLRARKRNRTPPSSEFLNSIKAGAPPVLRLGSGAEYTPTLSEKGGAYTHYPPCPPSAFTPNPYRTSSPMLDTKFPDEIMVTDIPSGRPSVEKPLHPQRFSAQHRPSTSIGSRRELWGSQGELSPVRLSPANTDSVLHFAPRFSLDDDPPPSQFSHSPPSLHPLRRQPDPDT